MGNDGLRQKNRERTKKKVNFISVLISRSHNDLRPNEKIAANKKDKKIENIFAGDYFLAYICTRKTKGTVA